MTFGEWFKGIVEPIVDVVIWTQDCDEDSPAFEGSLLDVPWYFLDFKINTDEDEPIYISLKDDKDYLGRPIKHPVLVVNLIAE